jgi:hypothetical protein
MGRARSRSSELSRQPERPGFGQLPEPGDLVGFVVIPTVLNVFLGQDIRAEEARDRHTDPEPATDLLPPLLQP